MGLFDAGLRSGQPVIVHDRVLTAANAITAVRLAGLPLFVYLAVGVGAYGIAALVLGTVAATDWFDGYVARRFDQVTRLGQFLDPLIDRILLATVALTLLALGWLPLWVVGAVVGRDVLLLGVGFALFRGRPPLPVSNTGKFATACLLVGVPGFLLANMDWGGAVAYRWVAWGFTLVGIAAYYVAGVQYAQAARAHLAARAQDGHPGA